MKGMSDEEIWKEHNIGLPEKEYIQTKLWKARRRWILKRANNKCEKCGAIGILHIHHKVYHEDFGHDKPEDLIALCPPCHAAEHPTNGGLLQKAREFRRDNDTWCIHQSKSFIFSTNGRATMDNGKTQIGIWMSTGEICERFQSENEQWKEKSGFSICDKARAKECAFYTPPSKDPCEHRKCVSNRCGFCMDYRGSKGCVNVE